MTAPTPRQPSEESVVAALRAVGQAVHAREVAADRRGELMAHLEAVQVLLADGAPRRRWYEVDPDDRDGTRARNRELSAFTGALNSVAPPMRIRPGTLPDGRPALIGTVRLDRQREGPPRSAHGGVVAGLFDELLGAGQRLHGGAGGMTGRLTVRYRRPTPLDEELEFRVWIHDERTRRVIVRGECVVATGTDDGPRPVTAEAEAVFLRVDFERLDAMMRGRVDGETPGPAAPPDPSR